MHVYDALAAAILELRRQFQVKSEYEYQKIVKNSYIFDKICRQIKDSMQLEMTQDDFFGFFNDFSHTQQIKLNVGVTAVEKT